MKPKTLALLFIVVLIAAPMSLLSFSSTSASTALAPTLPFPTLTPMPTPMTGQFVYYTEVEILWRGLDPNTRTIRLVNVRDEPNIMGKVVAYLLPYSKWEVDYPFTNDKDGNVWALLSAQENKWIPLRYTDGTGKTTYYTDWRE